MKYRIRKILSVLMILCLAVVSVPQMAMRAYADSSGKLKVVIAGDTKTIKYDAEKHEMPFKITYYIDKGNPGPPDAYEGAVDSRVNLKDQNDEYGKPLWPIDAGYYTTKLKDIYLDTYIATCSE